MKTNKPNPDVVEQLIKAFVTYASPHMKNEGELRAATKGFICGMEIGINSIRDIAMINQGNIDKTMSDMTDFLGQVNWYFHNKV